MEELKRRFDIAPGQLEQKLCALDGCEIDDADSLIRFHETLLFFRAYPPSAEVLTQVEAILKKFEPRVSQLRDAEANLSPLGDPEVSGIAGESVTSNFSYRIARWLTMKYPRQVSIDWDWFEDEDRFGATMPRFLPLLEEDAMVEAHVPYRVWLDAARGRRNELVWLIQQFESPSLIPARYRERFRTLSTEKAKAELYDSLKLHVTWRFGFRSSRSGMKLPVHKNFFHNKPLIQRREISLAAELSSPPIPLERLSRGEGERILDLARETSAVRYRELHGFTYGDPRRVLKANLGRGTEAFVMGVPPENRLPLRAYHAALIFKNGVPVAYFEGLSIFERMESGFNLYYTFREGETGWLYARILRLMRQLLGVTVFSIDPYQVGHENEEGIESGAFWFYRKLGFRPARGDLMKLARSEERKMATDPRHRTSASTLRKLADGHMLFEVPDLTGRAHRSDWDRFQIRDVGLAVQRRMGRDFDGNAQKTRAASLNIVKRALDLKISNWNSAELEALNNFAVVLAMIPGVEQWSAGEKHLAAQIIRAKADSNEARYLRLMQKHTRLRAGIVFLGS